LRKEESDPFDADRQADEIGTEKMKLHAKEVGLAIKKESAIFTSWLDLQMIAQKSRQDLEYRWAVNYNTMLKGALQLFTDNAFTVQTADNMAKGATKASVSLRSAADYYSKSVERAYQLHVVNTTYYGAMSDPDVIILAEHIKSTVLTDIEKVAFVIISPNVGLRPLSTNHHGERMALLKIEAECKQPHLELEVSSFTLQMDPQSSYSCDTPLRKEGLFVFSNQKGANGVFLCKWRNASLYKREGCVEIVPFNNRANFVNPSKSFVQGISVTSGHKEAEAKQTHSGAKFYMPVLTSCFAGMGFKATDFLFVREGVGFDATLADACLQLMAAPPAKTIVPLIGVSSLVTEGSKQGQTTMVEYIDTHVNASMTDLCIRSNSSPFRLPTYFVNV
jgi:hypothetical protein